MHTPTIESYPMEIASGTRITTKAIVSSLIPNMAPKRLNISIMRTITILLTPILARALFFSSLVTTPRNEKIPASIALLLFTTQKDAPITRMKQMIPACFVKPL